MPPFEVIPAIDLLGGSCVRLAQGRYQDATVYDEDPAAVARRFAAQSIRRRHVVDLDAAKPGRRTNAAAIGEVVRALALGVDRVVIGTAALRDPPLVLDVARRFPARVVVGIDARAGRVAVRGWVETSDARAIEVARRFEDAGVAAIVYTDIERDGMLTGPNLEATAELGEGVGIPVIASGGVRSVDDVRNLAALAERGVAGVIVGRALYTGAVDLAGALQVSAPTSGE